MQIIRISLIATLAMVSVAQDIPKTSQAAITARGPQPTEPPAIFKNHKLRRGIDSVWDRVTSKAESIGSAIASGDDDDETTTSGVSIRYVRVPALVPCVTLLLGGESASSTGCPRVL